MWWGICVGGMKMFSITDGKGFQITFDNGVRVSVQFGEFSYCDNYTSKKYNPRSVDCKNAEVAIIDKNGQWLTREYYKNHNDDVKGYQTPEEVLKILNWAKKRK
jgi:hypothetical protein